MSKYLELVEGSFTQEHFNKQDISNKPYIAYSIKDGKVIYTITKVENNRYRMLKIIKKDISDCEYKEVDLGLKRADGTPIIFADRNIGAPSPAVSGTYFMWGETEGYTVDACEYSNSELFVILKALFQMSDEDAAEVGITEENIDQVLPYLFEAELGLSVDFRDLYEIFPFIAFYEGKFDKEHYKYINSEGNLTKYYSGDNKTVLDLEDDAAYMNTNGEWRMPTVEELNVLYQAIQNNLITVSHSVITEVQPFVCSYYTLTSNIAGYEGNGLLFINDFILDPAISNALSGRDDIAIKLAVSNYQSLVSNSVKCDTNVEAGAYYNHLEYLRLGKYGTATFGVHPLDRLGEDRYSGITIRGVKV